MGSGKSFLSRPAGGAHPSSLPGLRKLRKSREKRVVLGPRLGLVGQSMALPFGVWRRGPLSLRRLLATLEPRPLQDILGIAGTAAPRAGTDPVGECRPASVARGFLGPGSHRQELVRCRRQCGCVPAVHRGCGYR